MYNKELKFETKQLHIGQENPDSATGSRAVPIYQTAAYVFENCAQAESRAALAEGGHIYSRFTNPTQEVFEQRIAALEGGSAALALASGSAAVTYTIQGLAACGDHIVAAKDLYGGTYNLLEHTLRDYGISTTFVDSGNLKEIEDAIQENTKAVYIETLGNPNSKITDIAAAAKIAHAHHIPLVVDNTLASPYLVRPIEYGADIVVHSATKFIGGHGAAIGGVVVESGNFNWEEKGKYPAITEPNASYHGVVFSKAAPNAAFVTRLRVILLRDMGATLSPLNAFLFLQGLETLSLRVERHVENTKKVLEFLNGHPKVEKINHPSLDEKQKTLFERYFPNGGGSIFTIDIKGSEKDAKAFIDQLKIFSLLLNVADAKSLVVHPASTTHGQLNDKELSAQGISRNTVRLSIGLEHIDDILDDLEQAFRTI